MIQLNLRKEEKKVSIAIKSAASPCPSSNTTPLQAEYPPHSHTRSVQQKAFTIRLNINNSQQNQKSPLPPPSFSPEDQKGLYLNRIAQSVEGLKRGLTLYRLVEKDEEKCRQTVLGWFKEAETAFFNCINRPSYSPTVLLAEYQKKCIQNLAITTQAKQPINISQGSNSINQSQPNSEVEQLREEVQAYRSNSVEALQKLETFVKMVKEMKSRQQAQRKLMEAERAENNIIAATLRVYIEQADSILKKITAKQEEEGKVTALEKEICRGFTIVKSKAYASQAI